MKPMSNQAKSLKFMQTHDIAFDASDPGTGKTYVQIMDFARQHKKDGKAMMVWCPKSLMRAAWANDIEKFAPHLTVSLAYANNRKKALATNADVVIVNIDGVKDLIALKPAFWKKFNRVVIDESETVKHHTSHRSKAAYKLMKYFKFRRCMSGTPATNGICDIWHQYKLLDDGQRLGKIFKQFQSAACTPTQRTVPIKANEGKTDSQGIPLPQTMTITVWDDRKDIEDVVADMVKDITIRHRFEDCVDIPENHVYSIPIQLSEKHQTLYEQMKAKRLLELTATTVTALNAAVVATKLLQISSGAVYNDDAEYSTIETERYELVADLVEARKHSVVFFQWNHQRDNLVAEFEKRKVRYAVWNPDKPQTAVEYQQGEYQVLLAHPASAAHGLTLTRGTATIWASPTYNLSWYTQGVKRIHRIGQKEKTETIVIIAEDTIDVQVWARLQSKNMNMIKLLDDLT